MSEVKIETNRNFRRIIHRVVLRDNIMGLTKGPIKRLLMKAGISRISSLVYHEVRELIKLRLEELLRNTITVTEYRRKATVTSTDVYFNLKHKQFSEVITAKKCILSTSKRLHNKIRHYQKQAECLFFSKIGFSRFIREISQDYKNDLRFSAEALLLIQLSVETYLVKLFIECSHVMVHSKRKTIFTKDIQLVLSTKDIVEL